MSICDGCGKRLAAGESPESVRDGTTPYMVTIRAIRGTGRGTVRDACYECALKAFKVFDPDADNPAEILSQESGKSQ